MLGRVCLFVCDIAVQNISKSDCQLGWAGPSIPAPEGPEAL
jgi:hypothetical protein